MTINIAKQFSKYPGGRFLEDGDFSGQGFREELLVPALREYAQVTVELDGTLGYGSSFLEEAFGGLIREEGFYYEDLKDRLRLVAKSDMLPYTIDRYMQEARPSPMPVG